MKIKVVKLNSKLLNEFINILLSAKWLTMIIKHTNAFKPLLGAKPADSAKEIDGLMSHGQVCTLLEKKLTFLGIYFNIYINGFIYDKFKNKKLISLIIVVFSISIIRIF